MVVTLSDETVPTVTSLLKEFLKSLPEPLVPFRLFQSFLKIAKKDPETWVNDAKALFREMPLGNQVVSRRLFFLLRNVSLEEAHNKMGAVNLAKVLFPILIYEDDTGAEEDDGESMEMLIIQFPLLEKTVFNCIQYSHLLFGDESQGDSKEEPVDMSGAAAVAAATE
jgi:hypothetical protein